MGYDTGKFIQRVNFNIDKCTDLVSVQNKLLELAQAEKDILQEYKNSDYVLGAEYNTIYGTIVSVFNATVRLLKERQKSLLNEIIEHENFDQRKQLISIQRHNAIDNRYEIKLLKFKNRLHASKCYAEYRTEKRRLRDKARENSVREAQKPLPP